MIILGSNLDADTLDRVQGSSFLRWSDTTDTTKPETLLFQSGAGAVTIGAGVILD